MDPLNFFYSNIVIIPGIAFLSTVILKFIIIKFKKDKFDFLASIGTGGMPSGHSAIVSSTASSLFIKHGFSNDLFALSLIFAFIVVYDAIYVRYEAGLHAKVLNKLNKDSKEKFNESLGHLPSEAFVGILLGILVAVVCYYL